MSLPSSANSLKLQVSIDRFHLWHSSNWPNKGTLKQLKMIHPVGNHQAMIISVNELHRSLLIERDDRAGANIRTKRSTKRNEKIPNSIRKPKGETKGKTKSEIKGDQRKA